MEINGSGRFGNIEEPIAIQHFFSTRDHDDGGHSLHDCKGEFADNERVRHATDMVVYCCLHCPYYVLDSFVVTELLPRNWRKASMGGIHRARVTIYFCSPIGHFLPDLLRRDPILCGLHFQFLCVLFGLRHIHSQRNTRTSSLWLSIDRSRAKITSDFGAI